MSLTIDHIVPQSLGGSYELDNLRLACWDCNLSKGDRLTSSDPQTSNITRLYHPNQQQWHEHFAWNEKGIFVIGLTAVGRATILQLKLNRPHLVKARRYWVAVGWHPPID